MLPVQSDSLSTFLQTPTLWLYYKTKACIVNLWFLYFYSVRESLCSWLCLNDSNESLSTHCLLIYDLSGLMCYTSCYECFTQSSHASPMRLVHCSSWVLRNDWFLALPRQKPVFFCSWAMRCQDGRWGVLGEWYVGITSDRGLMVILDYCSGNQTVHQSSISRHTAPACWCAAADLTAAPILVFGAGVGACIVSGVGGRVKKRLEYLTSRCNVPRNRRLMHSQISNAVIQTNHQTSIAGNTNLPFSEDSSPPVLTPHSPWAKEKQVFVLTEPKPIISQHSWATMY